MLTLEDCAELQKLSFNGIKFNQVKQTKHFQQESQIQPLMITLL
jgi:hypothetical protein